MDFVDGSYHSRLWWPEVKFMSVLWKMAAHWKGAAGVGVSLEAEEWGWGIGGTYRAVFGTWCNGIVCCPAAPSGSTGTALYHSGSSLRT